MARGRTSTKATATPLKRPLSPATKTLTPPSRQSKRFKSSPAASNGKSTPKKSQYFPQDSTDEKEEEEEPEEAEDEASGYEDEDDEAFASSLSEPPESESSVDEDEESEEEYTKSKRKRKSASKKVTPKANGSGVIKAAAKAIVEKGKELWREGVKADLAPGEEVFIKLPKARGDGGVKYEDGVVHPNTMLFLGDLGRNNEREWLKSTCLHYSTSQGMCFQVMRGRGKEKRE